jgi:hypothetical protein
MKNSKNSKMDPETGTILMCFAGIILGFLLALVLKTYSGGMLLCCLLGGILGLLLGHFLEKRCSKS